VRNKIKDDEDKTNDEKEYERKRNKEMRRQRIMIK
jgi:hypothetical protein